MKRTLQDGVTMETNKPRLTIATRLVAGFGIVLIALVALTAIAIGRVETVRARLDDVIDVNGVKQRYAINFRGSVHDRSIAIRDVTLVDPAELPSVIEHIRSLATMYEDNDKPLAAVYAERTDITSQERAIYARVNAARSRSMPLIDQVISLQQAGDAQGARRVLLDQARPALVEWLAAVNALIDYQDQLSQQEAAEARTISTDFKLLMSSLTLIVCVFGVVIVYLLVRHITKALGAEPEEVAAVAESIRAGSHAASARRDHLPGARRRPKRCRDDRADRTR